MVTTTAAAKAPTSASKRPRAAAQTPEQELASALVRTMHLLQDFHAESSRPLGLTPQQAHLLCVLLAAPLGMTELSRILSIERSSLTSMVDRLERRDLVTRTASATDRRACLIDLPAAARPRPHHPPDAGSAPIGPRPPPLPASCRRPLTTPLQ